MNYERNQKYFEPVSYKGAIWMIIIGIVVLIIGLAAKAWYLDILGLGLAAGGIAIAVSKKNGIVSDKEYDGEVAKMLSNLKPKALSKLGLDEDEVKEIAPISFDGFVYKGANKVKKGEDGLYRTNKYEFVMLFFSEHEVHCYTYNFDTTSQKQTEATDVYFYKDIVSVSTASDSIKVAGETVDYEYFKLTTAGGTALSVSLRDVSNAQRSINAMRSLLKAKKQA